MVMLTAGCAGESPLAFLKPKPAAQKTATADKLARAGALKKKLAAKSETGKPSSAPKPKAGAKTASTEQKKAGPTKAGPLSPEQQATAPLRPSDRLGPGFWIQLAAHFKAEGGEAAWKTLSARHRGLLSGEAHVIKRVDLGERGRFYRLLLGPYAGRGAAQEKCGRLRQAEIACFLITRRGRVLGAPAAGASKTVEPKPPATAVPSAAVKPRKRAAPRKAAVTATPGLVKPGPKPRGKAAKKKTGTTRAKKNRAADLPFQRRDSIPGAKQ